MERVISYIDGFNLYFGLRSKGWRRFYWLSWVDSTPRLVDGVLYVGSSDAQRVRAYDPANGRERWQAWVGGWTWGTPLVVGDAVYYATAGGDGYFIPQHASLGALDRRSGAILWRLPLANTPGRWPSGIASSLAYADGLVLAGALDGTLTAYRAPGPGAGETPRR